MVCSEQITFRLDGDAALALPSIVFSHLDSDLPLCFWWQGEFRKTLDEAFWQWIDRLIFDSRHWRDPATQFEIVRQIGTLSDARTVLCDLNWTRLHRTRFAIASLFDHSAALPCLAHIRRLHITHAPGFLTTAHLLTGWLASQLGWRHETLLAESFFVRQDGERVQVQLEEIPGADISVIELATEKSTFRLEREKDAPFFQTLIDTPAQGQCRGIVTAAGENMVDILVAELSRGGRHPLYSKAVATISPLLRGG
jgi:glucose-6-phosphate dehydrogenase assembly protein OpcA